MLVTTPMARRTRIPVEYVRSGMDRYSPSSVKSAISSTLACICLRVCPRNMPRMMMFSYPEISGSIPTPRSNTGATRPLM
ncbi:Uncharacterised protein [Mycobacteroides abscessus subsp. abscessus]|nr:Uncharacterised protein [Mycobacteroides abscessus subsp. abscessus]SHT63504.1 Uncharacterised protein [Mycobacteroides abscessus subsp. abscessus]